MTMHADDHIRLTTRATIDAYRNEDLERAIPTWRTIGSRLGAVRAIGRAVDEGTLAPYRQAVGSNKVLLQGIAKVLTQLRDGTPYRLTHLDLGSSATAVSESDTGVLAHVDAAGGVARLALTEKTIDGKILRTSTFLASSEYVGANLREAALCDAATGGTSYNRVLFTTPLLGKASTDTAVVNIDHTLTN